jgi:hypothetical protein
VIVLNAPKEGALTVLMEAAPEPVPSPLPEFPLTSFLPVLMIDNGQLTRTFLGEDVRVLLLQDRRVLQYSERGSWEGKEEE